MRLSPRFLLSLAVTVGSAHAQGNVLVLVADDLGVDRVAAYGEHFDPGHTPNIDRLASAGLLFRNAWSNPICSPTRATLLTGRYSFRTGIGRVIFPHLPGHGLDLAELTLPELLGPGFRAAALGKWHLSTATDGIDHPRDSGFEHYAGGLWNFGDMSSDYFRWFKVIDGARTVSRIYATTDTTDDAIAQLATLPEPWFLYVAYHAPHAPVHRPPQRLHTFDLSGDPEDTPIVHTKAMVEALDTELGRLLEHVDLQTTTVFFLGDNGTAKGASEAPFLPEHAKGTMYEGGVNVPLIVAGRDVVQGECAALVNTVDLFATVAELGGFTNTSPDSVSMLPYLHGDLTPRRSFAYAEAFKPNGFPPYKVYNQAIRGVRYKLIRRLDGEELYDLATDPFEQDDLLLHPFLTETERAAYRRLAVQMAQLLAS